MELEEKKKQPLTAEQVAMAQLFLSDLHPKALTPIEEAFPWLLGWVGWIKKCCASDEEKPNKQQLLADKLKDKIENKTLSKEEKKMKALKKMREEREKEENNDGGDPFLSFGFGIMSYRNTILNLCILFFIFTIITWPLRGKYAGSKEVMSEVTTKFPSLSNLGYASVKC